MPPLRADGGKSKFPHSFKQQSSICEYVLGKIIIIDMCRPSEMIVLSAHIHKTTTNGFQGDINSRAPVMDRALSVWVGNVSGPGNLDPHFFLDIQGPITIVYKDSIAP